MAEEQKFSIKITNFINPHLFHFKLENIIGQFDMEMEDRLKVCAVKQRGEKIVGEKKEYVLAYIVTWNKWVRGQIDLVLDDKHYIVWCIDQGVPMKLQQQHLLPMPSDLLQTPPSAFVGGLARCLPIEQTLDFATMKFNTEDISDFPEYLVSKAKQLIEESDDISFTPRQKMGEHIFGDIKIRKFNGEYIELVSELVKTGNVKKVDDFIPKGIEELFTTKKYRYENHFGNLDIRSTKMKLEMTFAPIAEADSEVSIRSDNLEEEKKFVLDWSRQNNALAKQMEEELQDHFQNTIMLLPQYEVCDAHLSVPFPRSYLFGRSTSSFGSSHSVLKGAGSTSTIHSDIKLKNAGSTSTIHSEDQSIISSPETEATVTSIFMAKKLSSLSLSGICKKPTPKKVPEAKKIVYIPSGYERDLQDFSKYNQI